MIEISNVCCFSASLIALVQQKLMPAPESDTPPGNAQRAVINSGFQQAASLLASITSESQNVYASLQYLQSN